MLIELLVMALQSAVTAYIAGLLVQKLAGDYLIPATATTGIAVSYVFFGLVGPKFLAVALSWLWIPLVILAIWGPIKPHVAKRGYLGNRKKWEYHIEATATNRAAYTLLTSEQLDEIADLSANKTDYENNVVRAAGLRGHEPPGVDEIF